MDRPACASFSVALFSDRIRSDTGGSFISGSSLEEVLDRTEHVLGAKVSVPAWRPMNAHRTAFEGDIVIGDGLAGHIVVDGPDVASLALCAPPQFIDEPCG